MRGGETRTVLTTGANSGLGLATVLELARRGFRSVGTVRSEAKAEIVDAAARDAGVDVETGLLDVTDAAACEDVVDRVRPFALVNNSGFPANGSVEDVGDEEARRAIETMVVAPIRLARLALPHMRARHEGRIVNISSVYGRMSTPLSGWYQGAKHALEAVSDALRMEVARDGVKVVVVEPGRFRTGIWEELERESTARAASSYETAYRRTLQGVQLTQPMMGAPQRVANVVAGAVTGRYPRARYLVGRDAQVLNALDRITPTLVKDRLSRAVLGL